MSKINNQKAAPGVISTQRLSDELHLTLCDALSGWKYVREIYGDLPGVGWDRVQKRLESQITNSADRLRKVR